MMAVADGCCEGGGGGDGGGLLGVGSGWLLCGEVKVRIWMDGIRRFLPTTHH